MSQPINAAAPAVAAPTNQPAPKAQEQIIETDEFEGDEGADPAVQAVAKPTTPKAKKAEEKRLKKLKLKIDGKEIEETIDLDDEDRLIRELQMSKMGQKRAQEKAELEKQVSSFFQAFNKDPFTAMKELGMDPNTFIDGYINQQLENAKKSPEQLQREQLEAELRKERSEREREKSEFNQKELERRQMQAFDQYNNQMEQSLAKTDLPKTPYTVKKIADYMLVALEAGKDVTPDDVIPLVREEMHNDLKEMFGSLPEETVEAILGEQVLNKLRKRRVAKAQASQQLAGKPAITDTGSSSKVAGAPKPKVSYKDFFKM